MTSIRAALAALLTDEIPGAPPAEFTVAPKTPEDAAAVLDVCSEHGLAVRFWGAGSRSGVGNDVDADVVMSTTAFNRVVDWQPEDLTLTVEGGVTLEEVDVLLRDRRQSTVLPEDGEGTVGGVVAVGSSGYRRLRYGPTRDRLLEVVLATGDGRVVRAGGRVVKNVTGFDIPRLVTGSLGSLGLICSVTVKLWPSPEASATVTVDDPERAQEIAYRPLAVLSDRTSTRVYLQGTQAEVEGQADALDGEATSGLHWPDPLGGTYEVEVRVPPAHVADALQRIPASAPYIAQHGVGVVGVALDDLGSLGALREWAEHIGGAAVVVRRPARVEVDPWGSPPTSLELQRRVKAAFDPIGICNPGILPGGL